MQESVRRRFCGDFHGFCDIRKNRNRCINKNDFQKNDQNFRKKHEKKIEKNRKIEKFQKKFFSQNVEKCPQNRFYGPKPHRPFSKSF